MKKVVIFLIAFIFVASIFIVNILGMKVQMFVGTNYVEKIEIGTVYKKGAKNTKIDLSQSGTFNDAPSYVFTFEPLSSDTENLNQIWIQPNLLPTNATNKNFRVDLGDNATVEDPETGNTYTYVTSEIDGDYIHLTFLRPIYNFQVQIAATDGHSKDLTVYFSAVK